MKKNSFLSLLEKHWILFLNLLILVGIGLLIFMIWMPSKESLLSFFIPAFGTLLIFVCQYLLNLSRSRKTKIKTYRCSPSPLSCIIKYQKDKGFDRYEFGEIMHARGESISKNKLPDVLRRAKDDHLFAWKWIDCSLPDGQPKPDSVEKAKLEECVLYGPYLPDFDEYQRHQVRFRIGAYNLPSVEPYSASDKVVMMLDVNRNEYHDIQNPGKHPEHGKQLARRYIRLHELEEGWTLFDLVLLTPTGGFYEYRAFVFDENIPRGIQLYFDEISLFRLYSFEAPSISAK